MGEFNYQLFEARVLTLTPLHIGTGRELMQDYDYAVHNGQTWRLSEAALLEAQNVDDPALLKRLMESPPAQLLKKPDDFQADSPYFRYFIRGVPRSQKPGSILREQIKTVDDRPYLPGSSLKGGLRTALAWHGWAVLNLRPEQRLIARGKFAARMLENRIFGPEPNYDLLRALQVGDSDPLAPDCLMLVNVAVWPAGRKSIPIEVEAVKRETRFRLPIKVDWQLFSNWARENHRDFRLGGAREWLEKLAALVRAHQAERIRVLRQWHEESASGTDIVTFYRDLEKLALKDNQFVLQLGWGGGWDSKTLGSRLSADAKFMDWLIREHQLSRARNRKAGDPFPATRRAAMRRRSGPGGQAQETPALPLGWVLVSLETGLPGAPEAKPSGASTIVSPSARPVTAAPTPAHEPVREPAAPPPTPPVESKAPFIDKFSELPKVGDRFRGEVFSVEGRALELLIPGLDDTVAYAYIAPEDNDTSKKFREGDTVICEVIGLTQQGKVWQVRCRRG